MKKPFLQIAIILLIGILLLGCGKAGKFGKKGSTTSSTPTSTGSTNHSSSNSNPADAFGQIDRIDPLDRYNRYDFTLPQKEIVCKPQSDIHPTKRIYDLAVNKKSTLLSQEHHLGSIFSQIHSSSLTWTGGHHVKDYYRSYPNQHVAFMTSRDQKDIVSWISQKVPLCTSDATRITLDSVQKHLKSIDQPKPITHKDTEYKSITYSLQGHPQHSITFTFKSIGHQDQLVYYVIQDGKKLPATFDF